MEKISIPDSFHIRQVLLYVYIYICIVSNQKNFEESEILIRSFYP